MEIQASEVVDSFLSSLEPPRLKTAQVLRKAITRGVAEGTFAYTSGALPSLGEDNKFQVNRDKVALGRPISDDEVDLESGFLMLPSAVPEAPIAAPPSDVQPGTTAPGPASTGAAVAPAAAPGSPTIPGQTRHVLELKFSATRDQIFKAFPAIANLAEKSDGGRIEIQVKGTSVAGYDQSWLRNAVEEPLDEANIKPESE